MPLITYLLLAYIVLREVMWFVKERDMLDRLMSRNLEDFKTNTKDIENEIADDDDNTIPILEAREEMLNG